MRFLSLHVPRESARGFTLIELLIVIAILAILTSAVVVVLNPAELLKQARDSQRIANLDSLSLSLKLAAIDGQNLGTSSVIYLSLPDTSSTCGSYTLSTSTGYTYHCATTSTYQKVDGTGWLPVNFDAVATLALATLPVDPSQNATSSLYYAYLPGSGFLFELNSMFESDAYLLGGGKDLSSTDGGDAYWLYERGMNLSLIPATQGGAGNVPSFSAALITTTTPMRGGAATFSRATTATVLGYCATCNSSDGQQVLAVASGEPRFQGARHISQNVWSTAFADGTLIPDSELLGYLSEGARTNLALNSEDISAWSNPGSATTANLNIATDPSGAVTADQMVAVAGGTWHYRNVAVATVTDGASVTASIFVKRDNNNWIFLPFPTDSFLSYFNVATGAFGTMGSGVTGAATLIGGGWWRITLTKTITGTSAHVGVGIAQNDGGGSFSATGTEAIFIWGAQIENSAAFASTYIPTTSAAVTRNADVLTYPTTNIAMGTDNGTVYFEVSNLLTNTGAFFGFRPFVSLNRLIISGQYNVAYGTGATVIDLNNNAAGDHAFAVSYGSGGGKSYVGGTLGQSNSTPSSFGAPTSFAIGTNDNNVTQAFGALRNVRIWTSALSAAQIAAQ